GEGFRGAFIGVVLRYDSFCRVAVPANTGTALAKLITYPSLCQFPQGHQNLPLDFCLLPAYLFQDCIQSPLHGRRHRRRPRFDAALRMTVPTLTHTHTEAAVITVPIHKIPEPGSHKNMRSS